MLLDTWLVFDTTKGDIKLFQDTTSDERFSSRTTQIQLAELYFPVQSEICQSTMISEKTDPYSSACISKELHYVCWKKSSLNGRRSSNNSEGLKCCGSSQFLLFSQERTLTMWAWIAFHETQWCTFAYSLGRTWPGQINMTIACLIIHQHSIIKQKDSHRCSTIMYTSLLHISRLQPAQQYSSPRNGW